MKIKEYRKIHVPDAYVEKWQKTVNLMARVVNAPAGLIMRVHSSRIEVFVASQNRGNPYKAKEMADLNTGLYCETVMANRSLLHVANALEDAEWKDNPDVKLNMISYLGLPLLWPDGSIFGTICVLDEKRRDYSRDYVDLLRQFKEIIEDDFKIIVNREKETAKRKKADIALRESENRYRTLFENATDAIFLMQGYRFKDCNHKTLEMFGFSREQIINNTPADLSPPTQPDGRDSGESAREKIDNAYEGNPQFFEWKHIKSDGTTFEVEVNLNRLNLSTGTYLLAIVRDIAERKHMEENLKEKQTRELLVLRSLPMAFYVAQPFGDYGGTWVSDQIDTISGFKPGEFMEDIHLWASRLHPEDKQRTLTHFDMLKKKDFLSVEYRWQAKNGKYVWILDQAILTRDENNQPKEIIGTWLDITEKKEAEQKEKQYQDHLMQADKMVSLGTLVSGVGHEINNPNNAIMFNAPLLKEIFEEMIPLLEDRYRQEGDFELAGLPYSELTESVNELFDGIIRSSDRIKGIVADLKNFARPESYDLNQEVDINHVVKTSLTLLKNMIKKSTNNFSVTYGKNIPPIKGNFQRLEQVMINLVQNACQALENNRQAIGVSISHDKKNQRVKVEVEDEGVGIEPASIKFITDPFFTTKRQQGGTGLGLSVSARIIRDHSGTLHIQSEPGAGSVFTVTLPCGK